MPEIKYWLVYDSECVFCERFKQGIEFMDLKKQVFFVSLYDPEVYEAFPELNYEECKEIVHMVNIGTREVFKGGDIAAELSKALPGVSKLAWLLETNRGRKATDLFYRKIDEMRKRVGKGCAGCS